MEHADRLSVPSYRREVLSVYYVVRRPLPRGSLDVPKSQTLDFGPQIEENCGNEIELRPRSALGSGARLGVKGVTTKRSQLFLLIFLLLSRSKAC